MIKFESYKKWVNEKFTEDVDPIESMGIGMMHDIDKWIDSDVRRTMPAKETSNSVKLDLCVWGDKAEYVDYLIPIVLKEELYHLTYNILYRSLDRAIRNNCLNVTKLLIEKYNQDIYQKNGSLLTNAALSRHSFNIFKYFVEELGVDVNYENGRIFIWLCCTHLKDGVDRVQYFIDHGANVNIRNDMPLLKAALNGRVKIARLLLDNGAKINLDLKSRVKYWKTIGRRKLITNLFEKRGLI